MGTHSHAYADGFARNNVDRLVTRKDRPHEAMIRVFFYVSGFNSRDGGCLKVIPGSHEWRDPGLGETLRRWSEEGKSTHLGVPLEEVELECPPGSVILMLTHATRRHPDAKRCCATMGLRRQLSNRRVVGSIARVITSAFAAKDGPGGLTVEMKRQGRDSDATGARAAVRPNVH